MIRMVQAVYFHIPFCEHICYYCDFNKVFLKGQPVDDYLNAMVAEMANTVQRFQHREMKTLFVGGGTPTVLDLKQTEKLLDAIRETFAFDANAEFTVEANPGSVDFEKLTLLKEGGVNRLSFGVQAFQDELLKAIGRDHCEEDIEKSISLARQAGFDNISLDLMFGLPGQSPDMFLASLQKAIALGVDHLSAYSLQIEPRTIFYNRMNRGKLHLPSEDEEVNMYERLIETMESHGFLHYEISNFAKPGKKSSHNLTYWNNDEYYGIGAGAHSYVNGVRRENVKPIKKYIMLMEKDGFPYREEHKLTIREQMEEEMFMGLRKRSGVSKTRFYSKFNVALDDVFSSEISDLVARGLLTNASDRVALTKKGVFLGNEVFQAFIA